MSAEGTIPVMKKILRSLEDQLLAPFKKKRLQKQLARFEEKKGLFSALNEDLVLQELIGKYGVKHFYVDIGASDGVKWSNTARLALNQWQGVCFEYDPQKVGSMAQTYNKLDPVCVCRAKMMPTNVLDFFRAFAIPKDLGVLSIDIDSYDYFILEELFKASWRPSIIISEINILIPPPLKFTILFNENFWWQEDEFQGYSLSLLESLCEKYNYALVHLEWNNAFLVAKELLPTHHLTASQAFERHVLGNTVDKEWMEYDYKLAESLFRMPPQQAYAYFDNRFKSRAGNYSLTY